MKSLLLTACALILFSSRAIAQSAKVIFYYDERGNPIVRLDRIGPMSEALRAVVAMYALQNGAGCSGGSQTMKCSLTSALKIGGQCSKRHLALVRTWFSEGIPKMGGYPDFRYKQIQAQGALEDICYNAPDSATFQQVWDIIRLKVNGAQVLVDAHGTWVAREKTGSFRYVTEYEVGERSVKVVSHRDAGARKAA